MPESRPETIAAVVVTYNRKRLLGDCLDSLLRQTHPPDALYIIDNGSMDGTCESLLDRSLISRVAPPGNQPQEMVRTVSLPGSPVRYLEVHYVRMPQNTGGAGGFAEGMKRASDAGFDWLWLMDDDVLASPDALEALVRKKEGLQRNQSRSFLLNSLVLARGAAEPDALAFPLQELSARGYPRAGIYHWRLTEIRDQIQDGLYRWACPFNGTFVPARAVAEVGLPNEKFFIQGDERDYLWRAAKRFRLYTAVDSRIFHPPTRRLPFDWKQYYCIRNTFVVNRHFNFSTLRNLKLIVLSLGRGACHGRRGIRLVLRAIRDGRAGRLGRRDDLHP